MAWKWKKGLPEILSPRVYPKTLLVHFLETLETRPDSSSDGSLHQNQEHEAVQVLWWEDETGKLRQEEHGYS